MADLRPTGTGTIFLLGSATAFTLGAFCTPILLIVSAGCCSNPGIPWLRALILPAAGFASFFIEMGLPDLPAVAVGGGVWAAAAFVGVFILARMIRRVFSGTR